MYTLFLYFVIYSFLGWVCETVYCSLSDKKFVNRGFLNGPFCPIYGCGALAVIVFLVPIANHAVFIFIFGAIAASVIEYITSYLLEFIFGLKLWDYSSYNYNLNGRVCLKNSLMFGVLSVALVEVIHPKISIYIERLSISTVQLLSLCFSIYFLIDFIISTGALVELRKKIDKLYMLMKEKTGVLATYKERAIEEFKHKRLVGKEELKKELMDLSSKVSFWQRYRSYQHRRLLQAFPRFQSKKHTPYLKAIKEELKKAVARR